MKRFLLIPFFIAAFGFSTTARAQEKSTTPLNILLLTVDDMNYDSLGITGCKLPNITPHLDKLAGQGMLFNQAHVTIAVCQPCRESIMTGLFPIHNGGEGFQPITTKSLTLTEVLKNKGYLTGILGKTTHLAPPSRFPWDYKKTFAELHAGRSPEQYYKFTQQFLAKAKEQNKPFFLMANAHDPHRPFIGSQQENRMAKRKNSRFPKDKRIYEPKEVDIPGFLPDLPEIRLELAEYYSSVHRADAVMGKILQAVNEAGYEDSTLVLFLSDHGMALPFAKTNCYFNSTRTPLIVRWPGTVKPGRTNNTHLISGIDLMPTILQSAKIGSPPANSFDGQSFLPLLQGKEMPARPYILTVFHQTSGKRRYDMRCLRTLNDALIWNPWSDGKTKFKNESQNGRTFKAMTQAGKKDKKIRQRVDFFLHRTPLEFYDLTKDPAEHNNLLNDPAYQDTVAKRKEQLLQRLKEINDPILKTHPTLTTK